MFSYTPIIDTITYNNYKIGVLRLDLIDVEVSGNKWFKLKYNLQQAIANNKNTIITFGGAFSNHIAATAAACKKVGLKSIGIIRGEALAEYNDTLSFAKQNGMELMFLSRTEYQQKETENYLTDLQNYYPNAYIIPEGGSNVLGENGCSDILVDTCLSYSSIFCGCGTQTTFKGIASTLSNHQFLFGVNVLKYEALSTLKNTTILNKYHFGGYAKHTNELIKFKKWFESTYIIKLDYVYTAKLFFAAFDMMRQNELSSNEPVLLIHSGGLQGNTGYEKRYNLQ